MNWHSKTRTRNQRVISGPLVCWFIVALTGGCGKDKPAEELPNPTAVVAPVERPEPVHSVLPDSAITQSPATAIAATDQATSTPESVCQEFIKRLQTGDRIGAENLLTRTALTTTQQADLKLEPVCGAAASTQVFPARYASKLQRVAEVDCVVTDSVGNEPVVIPMTWQVVRQANGWRVSGMLVSRDGSPKMKLLSFESIDDVATIKLLATRDALSDPQTMRQAEAHESSTTLQ